MNLKELYQISKKELDEIIENKNPDFRLEQAEFDKTDKTWDIVVSYLEENNNKRFNVLTPLVSDLPFERIFKKMKIKEDKEVLGFYIYDNK
jgi:uncharacterized protein YozE (UPF0346 family)